ncbi:hypothetical protein [Microbispora sp. ATCC PTA-5024]|uniref:hypothetical protein n=1 Tax=Microbispora sp. ATCC PTA-5024 TaxID=316330 RepID=UPI0003DC3624|nr:hypothetical protein [Microbispora sp. ATCC PTA-5024]ETK37263.1 hypothetical protein MPTA5024_04835 [Microbispora sp. ATCC PTA-5024]
MRIKTWLLVTGAAAAVVAGGSGIALATSAGPANPVAGSHAGKDAKPADQGVAPRQETFFTEERIGILASELGISGEQAHDVGGRLEQLAAANDDSLSPGDPAFIAIAESVGKTAHELAAAVDTLKKMG